MRESVLHVLHAKRSPAWTVVNGMQVPDAFSTDRDPRRLVLADLSCLIRCGLKGPHAADWLGARGIAAPGRPNSWNPLGGGGIIARLAETEFFLEDPVASDVAQALEHGAAGVYPVARQDVGLALSGERANEVLLETCSVNFAALDPQRGELALTSMVGVPVLVIPRAHDGVAVFRIWTDPSFGPYLWETLLEIVEQLGGGPAGFAHPAICRKD